MASRAIRDSLITDPALAQVRSHWDHLTVALVGIGSLEPSPLLAQSGNAIPPVDQNRLRRAGAVGDVCHHFFTAGGKPIRGDLESRVVAIPIETYLTIPRRVGIAGGPRKTDAIRAALTGGWVNVIMTDLQTARALLDR